MYQKALTFSYDDGVEQDKKLLEILNRYGMKCTFNLNSGIQKHDTPWFYKEKVPVYRMNPEGLGKLYRGHEIAVHGLNHINLKEAEDDTAEKEIAQDKENLENMFHTDIYGMAYAFGSYTDKSVEILKKYGIKYARTTETIHSFDLEKDMLRYRGTCHHSDEDLFSLGEQFLNLHPDRPQIFYVWGHSYEFDLDNGWERIEAFCRMMHGKDDILYGTNQEVFAYFGMIEI